MISQDRSCAGKRQYLSRPEAKRDRRRIYSKRHKEKDGPLSVYKCPFCDFYHIGHMPADVRNGTIDKSVWTGVSHVRD